MGCLAVLPVVGLGVVLMASLALRGYRGVAPGTMVLLYTLSAYLCPIWLYEDPALGSSDREEGRAYARALLLLMAPVYLALVAAQLPRAVTRLPPAP